MTAGSVPVERIVGRSVPRLESEQKVTGQVRYVADLVRPGMLHGRFVRSPYPHARIDAVDASDALAVPGVVAVISAESLAARFPGLPPFDLACRGLDRPADETVRPGDFRLFDRTVRFVGEPVALVIADSEAAAGAGADLVDVRYEPLPATLDLDAARADGAAPIHADAPGNLVGRLARQAGDVAGAMAGAALVVERTFATSKQKQAQLEPTGCLAEVDASGKLTVWSPHQAPHRARFTLAGLFGLPLNEVRVVVPPIGGAFGKSDALTVEPYAAAAAFLVGRPVRIVLSRSEDFVGTESRHPTTTTLAIGFNTDGTIAALRGHTLVDAGAYRSHSPNITAVLIGQFLAPYRVAAYDLAAEIYFTNTPVSGAFRGYGGPQAAFPLEHLVDLGCLQLGVDPLAARQRMRVRRGDPWGTRLEPLVTDIFGEVMARGAAEIGWESGRSGGRGTGSHRRGIGMAAVVWKSGVVGKGLDQSGASVRVNLDGTIYLSTAAADLGTGVRTTLAQICAEVLGVDLARVRLSPTDTDVTPFESGAFASRSLYRAGQAVNAAAVEVRQAILEYASEKLEIDPRDLELVDGSVGVRGDLGRSIALPVLLRQAMSDGHEFHGYGEAPRTTAASFSAQFAEVDVDTETGQVTVLRMVAVQDVGRAINPSIVEGQIQGAVHQGIGYALSEGLVVDAETGTVLNGTYMDYRLLTSADTPEIRVVLLEEADPTGPFGAKGVGEPGIVTTAPAIANAILDATGASVTELPMSPERVLAALDALRPAAT